MIKIIFSEKGKNGASTHEYQYVTRSLWYERPYQLYYELPKKDNTTYYSQHNWYMKS